MIITALIGLLVYGAIVALVAYVIVRILALVPNVPAFLSQVVWLVALLVIVAKVIEVLSTTFAITV